MASNQMFESEAPKPIEFKTNGSEQPKERKNSKKKVGSQKQLKMGSGSKFFESQTQQMFKKKVVTTTTTTVKVVNSVQQHKGGDFNLDTKPMKYFDPNLDIKSKREQERDLR